MVDDRPANRRWPAAWRDNQLVRRDPAVPTDGRVDHLAVLVGAAVDGAAGHVIRARHGIASLLHELVQDRSRKPALDPGTRREVLRDRALLGTRDRQYVTGANRQMADLVVAQRVFDGDLGVLPASHRREQRSLARRNSQAGISGKNAGGQRARCVIGEPDVAHLRTPSPALRSRPRVAAGRW